MKLLFTSDIHIGRRPGGLPHDADGHDFSAGVMWQAVVDKAISERVSIVLLAGDVVDRDNRMCEAFGPLERGLNKLGQAGILTIAVSGNHDFDVLPQLTRILPEAHFQLLGQGGRWQRFPVEQNGKTALYVDGWSYPTKRVGTDPLQDYDLEAADAPVLGLLHTDVTMADHPYAPTTREQLRAARPRFWLLGHIHAPSLDETGGTSILYPGTPQAVSRKDFGVHGVWIGELGAGGTITPSFHPLSLVEYRHLDVDVTGAAREDEVIARVLGALRDAVTGAEAANGCLAHLVCRVTLSGRSGILGALEACATRLVEEGEAPGEAARGSIEKVTVSARPDYDVAELAREGEASAVGVLAGLLCSAEAGRLAEEYPQLVQIVHQGVEMVDQGRAYLALEKEAPATEARILQEGMRLLDVLMEQRLEGTS